MFGFERIGKRAQRFSFPPLGTDDMEGLEGLMTLVSKEDIYRDLSGATPTLLLRKGQVVQSADLSKLIQNGARPDQFRLQSQRDDEGAPQTYRSVELAPVFVETAAQTGMSNPIVPKEIALPAAPPPSRPTMGSHVSRAHRRVMILEPAQKAMKRLTDCLFACGFKLDNIHPVRIPAQLEWSLKRHQPDLLVLDYHLDGNAQGLILLTQMNLSRLDCEIVVTVDAETLNPAEIITLEKYLKAASPQKAIKILYKPINRFAMDQLLDCKSAVAAHQRLNASDAATVSGQSAPDSALNAV